MPSSVAVAEDSSSSVADKVAASKVQLIPESVDVARKAAATQRGFLPVHFGA